MSTTLQRAVARPSALLRPLRLDPLASSFASKLAHDARLSTARSQARLWHTSSPLKLRPSRGAVRPTRNPQQRHTSNKSSPDVTPQLGSPQTKLGLQARMKKLFKQYGYVSVGVYMALSAIDMPFCFLAVRLAGPERIGRIEEQILSPIKKYSEPVWDTIEPVAGPIVHAVSDVASKIGKGVKNIVGFEAHKTSSDPVADIRKGESASIWTQLALAYGIHKTLLIFLRVPLTAVLTPKVARTLQSWGYKVGGKASN